MSNDTASKLLIDVRDHLQKVTSDLHRAGFKNCMFVVRATTSGHVLGRFRFSRRGIGTSTHKFHYKDYDPQDIVKDIRKTIVSLIYENSMGEGI